MMPRLITLAAIISHQNVIIRLALTIRLGEGLVVVVRQGDGEEEGGEEGEEEGGTHDEGEEENDEVKKEGRSKQQEARMWGIFEGAMR